MRSILDLKKEIEAKIIETSSFFFRGRKAETPKTSLLADSSNFNLNQLFAVFMLYVKDPPAAKFFGKWFCTLDY